MCESIVTRLKTQASDDITLVIAKCTGGEPGGAIDYSV